MPYNRQHCGIARCLVSRGKQRASSARRPSYQKVSSGQGKRKVFDARPVPTVHPVQKIWFKSPAGTAVLAMPALLPIPVFLASEAFSSLTATSGMCGRATQEVRWLAHNGMRTISCRNARQLDAKIGKCTAWMQQVSG